VGKEKIPIVLVGNKADQRLEFRNVKHEEGVALAKKLGCPYFEVTAYEPALAVAPFAALARNVASHLKESSDSMLRIVSFSFCDSYSLFSSTIRGRRPPKIRKFVRR